MQPCCTSDGGWSPEAAVQAEASNHPLLLPLREVVVSEMGKGRARPCQVRIRETNASEPLMTCRNVQIGVETGALTSAPLFRLGVDPFAAQLAPGMKVA